MKILKRDLVRVHKELETRRSIYVQLKVSRIFYLHTETKEVCFTKYEIKPIKTVPIFNRNITRINKKYIISVFVNTHKKL